MTPEEHIEESERLLKVAADLEPTPRVHLSKNFALLAIGHALSALAQQNVETGTPKGAFGRTTQRSIALAVEHIAHNAAEHLKRPSLPCVSCGEPDPDGPIDSDGNPWCSACYDEGYLEGQSSAS